MPRNFALVMTAAIRRKFEKTGLEIKDFFEEKNFLFNHWVVKNTHDNLTLSESINAVQNIFADIKARALKIDKTLGPLVSAETKEVLNRLEKVEGKFLKAERRRQGDKLRQIEVIKESLFPENDLQERHDNFLTFYQQDPEFIQKIIDCFDPFDFRFNAVSYHDQG